MPVLEAGAHAPLFTLRGEGGKDFTQDDLEGRTTVLVFYPFAFSSVCSDQFQVYQEVLEDIRDRGAEIYGVSCDATDSQRAFREALGVDIPMLSDFEPKGETCRAFGVYWTPGGMANRALVVIGPDGVVRSSWEGEHPGKMPGANLIFDGLDAVPA
jgi:peroxiredoxin (alkyl hydroperoxide reductase subunit C)